jgi:putative DNA methylase
LKLRRKLIEVALPLEAINEASVHEKSIRHGHPSTLHLWWARRPLAAARAVIFSQMIDDPSEYIEELLAHPGMRQLAERELRSRRTVWLEKRDHQAEAAASGDVANPDPGPEPTLEVCAADVERARLFRLIEQLVLWENTMNESLLREARYELRRSWRRTCADNRDHPLAAELFDPERLPTFHDPFAGGGALPLEAQRLGLHCQASDLNPVAVLINKAMIEIPPKFAGRPPVNADARRDKQLISREWKGAQGLAEDVRHYGTWMSKEAERQIGHLYSKVEITDDMTRDRPDLKAQIGRSLTVIAWIWARTVRSPNPAFSGVDVPLASTFMLSSKAGKEAYVEPVIWADRYSFTVKTGKPSDMAAAKSGTTAGKWNAFRCLMSGVPVPYEYIRHEAVAGRMGTRLMAVVVESERGRTYLSPDQSMIASADEAHPTWVPDLEINFNPRDIKTQIYGLTKYGDLFTRRQLAALNALSDIALTARDIVFRQARLAGWPDDGKSLADGGCGARAYADALAVYLGMTVSKATRFTTTLAVWRADEGKLSRAFGRQAIPITWDFAETNPFAAAGGDFEGLTAGTASVLEHCYSDVEGSAIQADAATLQSPDHAVISTDPPYYDNIGYADLSDYFYVWLRRALKPIMPTLFSTIAVPKAEELVATPYRHGSKERAEEFFLDGMTQAMRSLARRVHPAVPLTVYYAFKQSEIDADDATTSTGWEVFLDALIHAGLVITGTWPIRTEGRTRVNSMRSNTLASSIVLSCRPRLADAGACPRREFLGALKAELPVALSRLQRGNIAPVDLAQAAIGPGMAVYTRYARVVDADGTSLSVRDALAIINRTLDQVLTEQQGDFDADSRWALAWYEQFGFGAGRYGDAETLSRAKNTSVEGMIEAGIIASKAKEVRLLKPAELSPDWDPATDHRRPAWQAVHQLIEAAGRGETALAGLIAKLGHEADIARELAYRLYALSERKKWTEEASWYNGLVQSWPEAVRLAADVRVEMPVQGQLFGEA